MLEEEVDDVSYDKDDSLMEVDMGGHTFVFKMKSTIWCTPRRWRTTCAFTPRLQAVSSGTPVKILCDMIKAGLIVGPHHCHGRGCSQGEPHIRTTNIKGSTTRKNPSC
jgi:hypothetical protein